jgi:hypothetical protein
LFRNRKRPNSPAAPSALGGVTSLSPKAFVIATKAVLTPYDWKLRVTSLSAQQEAQEVVVQAENWLSALRAGRALLGEEGGVPSGASCAMSDSGEVTILDGAKRCRYLLTRIAAAGQSDRSSADPEAERAAATERDLDEERGASSALPFGARPSSAPPGAPGSLDLAAAHAAAAAAVRSARAKQTLAFSPERADALRREYQTALVSAGMPAKAATIPAQASAASAGTIPRAATAATQAGGSLTSRARTGSLRALPGLGEPRGASSATEPRRSSSSAPAVAHEQGGTSEELELLLSRDLEPSTESPLSYRERAFALKGGAERVRLEVLLQAELACLMRELAGRPRGQFVHLAVFDHHFHETPERPPVASLEWRDWRGAAVFSHAGDTASRAVAAPVQATSSSEELEQRPPARASDPAIDPRFALPPPAIMPHARSSVLPPEGAPALSEPNMQVAPERPSTLPPPAAAARLPDSARASMPPPAILPPARRSSIAPIAPKPAERSNEGDHRLATAFEAMPELYFLPTPVAGLEFTVQLLARLVPSEAISSCLYDINTDEFRFVALTGAGALDRQASAVPSSAGLFGVAKRSTEDALIVPDALSETHYEPSIDGRTGLAVQALAYAPVRYAGQLLGMLQLINSSDALRFSATDAAVLTYIAKQLAEFLASRRSLV